MRSHFSEYSAKHFVSLLESLGVLSKEVVRYGELYVTLVIAHDLFIKDNGAVP